MTPAYERALSRIQAALEELPRVKGSSRDYLTALEVIREEVDTWFDASIDAALDDVRRAEGDD